MVKKNTAKYLCIDTNIFIQCCFLEIHGDNLDVLNNLHKLLDNNKVELLLPEVIKLEFYKKFDNKIEQLKNSLGAHKKSINMDNDFGEKIKEGLIAKLEEWAVEMKKLSEKVKEKIEEIFNHKNVVQVGLELTPQIFVEAYKTSLSELKPFNKDNLKRTYNSFSQDCLIIESLKVFLRSEKSYEFYFCSDDGDFTQRDISGELEIHKDIKKRFNHILYYKNVGSLLNEKFRSKISKASIKKLDEREIDWITIKDNSTVAGVPFDSAFRFDSQLGTGEQLPGAKSDNQDYE